jgi:hypothetical protein
MKIAIADASIFIEIIELNISGEFFAMELEVHTSLDVYNELAESHQQLLNTYQLDKILFVHNITSEEQAEIYSVTYPKAFSCADKTGLYLVKKCGAKLLSCDKPVREYAKANSIDVHGMLWIFDELLKNGAISPVRATKLILELFSKNSIYRNKLDLQLELNKRLSVWSAA